MFGQAFEPWAVWKKGFDVWEDATAKYLEQLLKSPMILGGSGAMLTALMKLRAASRQAKASFWAEMGLPTKHDQERSLHLLNQIQSRLMDLEDRVDAGLGAGLPSTLVARAPAVAGGAAPVATPVAAPADTSSSVAASGPRGRKR